VQEHVGSWNVNPDILSPLTLAQDVEWLKSITSLPILLKGIVTAEDGKSVNHCSAFSLQLRGNIYCVYVDTMFIIVLSFRVKC
jgi:hypothetical protein